MEVSVGSHAKIIDLFFRLSKIWETARPNPQLVENFSSRRITNRFWDGAWISNGMPQANTFTI
jgi:hypothetical protein